MSILSFTSRRALEGNALIDPNARHEGERNGMAVGDAWLRPGAQCAMTPSVASGGVNQSPAPRRYEETRRLMGEIIGA